MNQGRRGFLKMFGVSTAAIVAAPITADAEPTVEVVKTDEQIAPKDDFNFLRPIHRADMMDVRDEPLWSSLRIEPNSMMERYSLFQQTAQDGFSLGETNMHIPGSLIQPEAYCIKEIGFVFSPKTIPALRSAFIDRYALELRIGQKRYWHAPLSTVFSVGEPERDTKGFATLPDAGFASLEIPL